MKFFEIAMYILYLLSIGVYLFDIINNKDVSKISALIWVFNATIMFTLYRYTDRTLDQQTEWRDKLIEELFKDKIDSVKNSFNIEIEKEDKDESI